MVAKAAADNLKFPSKCAYCLELTPLHHVTVKHDKLKGYELKVPYCETHSRMIRYMKLVQYGAIASTILFAVLLGRYLHNHQVFVVGFPGLQLSGSRIHWLGSFRRGLRDSPDAGFSALGFEILEVNYVTADTSKQFVASDLRIDGGLHDTSFVYLVA